MRQGVLNRLTYANVVSTLCLFVLLGGGAYAAVKLDRNSVGSREIKDGKVRSVDVGNGSLLGEDFGPGQLPEGAQGDQGVQGPPGAAGLNGDDGVDGVDGADGSPDTPGQVLAKLLGVDGPGSGVDADLVDGFDSASILRYGSTIPSGTTLIGGFSTGTEWDSGNAINTNVSVHFPLPAPVALVATDVNFEPGLTGSDDDSACTGTFEAPTAPTGKVCIYSFGHTGNNDTTQGVSLFGTGGGAANRLGFRISGPQGTGQLFVSGTWAYTAP